VRWQGIRGKAFAARYSRQDIRGKIFAARHRCRDDILPDRAVEAATHLLAAGIAAEISSPTAKLPRHRSRRRLKHDPEKWKPVSRLREAQALVYRFVRCFAAGEGRSEKIMLKQ
jgi:hypothetical protein